MKKLFYTVVVCAVTSLSLSSCEKCIECRYQGTDLDNDDSTSVCSKNRAILNDQVRVLEKTNWVCEE